MTNPKLRALRQREADRADRRVNSILEAPFYMLLGAAALAGGVIYYVAKKTPAATTAV